MTEISSFRSQKVAAIPFSKLWVLEWSTSQQSFHNETLLDALKSNIGAFCRDGATGDWVLLGVFETRESCDQFQKDLAGQMKKWGLSTITIDDLLRGFDP